MDDGDGVVGSRWIRTGAFVCAGVFAARAVARIGRGQQLGRAVPDALIAFGTLLLARVARKAHADAPRESKGGYVSRGFGWTSPLPASIH